jgi:hypothetical protein
MFAVVIPTEQYDLTNDEFATVANNRRDANPRLPTTFRRQTHQVQGGRRGGR